MKAINSDWVLESKLMAYILILESKLMAYILILESKLMAYILITRPSTDILIGKYYGYIASFYYRLEREIICDL